MKNNDSQNSKKAAKHQEKQPNTTNRRRQGQTNTKKGNWPGLIEAKGYQDTWRTELPQIPHLQRFLIQKPLARAIPNPVATPPLPPQEKLLEIQRFLWFVATQQFPSALRSAQGTVKNVDVYRMYGLTTRLEFNNQMRAQTDTISAEQMESQINGFYIRVITHAFKTWRHMIRIHREARAELEKAHG